MWIPAGLYEKLPAIYALISVITVASLGIKGMGGFCAAMLMVAAVRIHTWRRAYRS